MLEEDRKNLEEESSTHNKHKCFVFKVDGAYSSIFSLCPCVKYAKVFRFHKNNNITIIIQEL